MPVKPTEFCIEEAFRRRSFVRQGRLSRHKVSVGEPADGSPPINLLYLLTIKLLDTNYVIMSEIKNF